MLTAGYRKWTLALILLAAVGCAQKLTYERWETIHDGEDYGSVESTLGDPFQQTAETWVYQDTDRGITAMVYFQNGQVIGKKWACPEHGMQGKSPHVNQPGESEEIIIRETK